MSSAKKDAKKPFHGLKTESVNASLNRMARRSLSSMPFHFVIMAFAIFAQPEVRHTPLPWWTSGLLLLTLVTRLALRFRGRQLLATPSGQMRFRLLFWAGDVSLSLIWGGSLAYCYAVLGPSTPTFLLTFAGLAAAVVVVPIASFELGLVLTYMAITMALPIVTIFALYSDGDTQSIAYAFLLYFGLMFLMGGSLRKTQIALLQAFEKLEEQERQVKRAHAELSRTHDLIRAMLESLDQAFLLFNGQGYCISAPSQKSKALLAGDPTDKHISEILPGQAGNEENLSAWIEMIFLDRLQFEELASHGPARAQIPETGSTLKLKYAPMRDGEGQMSALVFTATDITQEMKAEQAASLERERAEMILRILDAKSGFQPFLKDFTAVVQTMLKWKGENVAGLRRDLHTMKGGAMLFGASLLAREVYAAELAIINHGETAPGLVPLVHERGRTLGTIFEAWQRDNAALFTQLGVFAHETIEVPYRRVEEVENEVADRPEARALVAEMLSYMMSQDLTDLLREFEMHVRSTAGKLGKQVRFQVESVGAPVLLPPGRYREALRSFVHMFNNAIDHGLETSEMRVLKGKPVEGNIRVSSERIQRDGQSWIRILVADDGGGIDVAKIRRRLVEGGEPHAAKMPELEIAMCIFNPGLSTRTSVTELSGQGVGMGSVRAAVQQAGGAIRILKTDADGTTFEILLPDLRVVSLIPPESQAS